MEQDNRHAGVILLVEDNKELNAINRRALALEGHDVHTAMTLAQARACLVSCNPDVILLDVLMPDGNGLDFCHEIRRYTDAHILFLTARSEHEDRIRGLESGGDDYISKPYRLDELLSRVHAALRRRRMGGQKQPLQVLEVGPLTLDTISFQAQLCGRDLLLTQKEFAMLLLLAQNAGKTLSKEYLYQTVWNQPMGDDRRAVWQRMSRLKRKLEEAGGRVAIAVSRGEGYRMEINSRP